MLKGTCTRYSKKNMNAKNRKKVARVIEIVNESYVSHVDGCVEEPKDKCPYCGTRKFHVKTNLEYLEALRLLHEIME